MTSSLSWGLELGGEGPIVGLGLGVLEVRRESSQALEEEEREGKALDLSSEAVEGGVGRRVALWICSRGVWDFDCLPKVRGN